MKPQKSSARSKPPLHRTSHKPFFSSQADELSERVRADKLLASRNYFLYLSSLLQRSQLYHLWRHYLNVFRKFRLVSILFRIYSYLLVLLQLGTAFVVIVIGILILLPILLLSAGCVIFSALLLYRRENKSMEHILSDKRVAVFFPTRDGEFGSANFWKAHIEDLAERQNTAVLIVSPFFWSGKGLSAKRFYFLLRKEKNNVYLLRKHYYFSLKRAILEKKRDSLALIY